MWRTQAKDVGFSSPERESGVTPKVGEIDDMLPMNPEGAEVDVPQGLHRLTNAYVGWTPYL